MKDDLLKSKGKSGKFSDCNPKFAKKGSKVSKDSGDEADEEEEDSRMSNKNVERIFFAKNMVYLKQKTGMKSTFITISLCFLSIHAIHHFKYFLAGLKN